MSLDHDAGFGIVPRHLRGDLNAYEIAVYVALTWRAGADGTCFPSHATLAADAGCSKPTVKRALNTLRDKGIVSWVRRMDPAGDMTSNGYRIAVYREGWGLTDPTPAHTDPTVGSDRPDGGLSQTYEVEPLNETQGSSSSSPASRATVVKDDGFDGFWNVYPRKVGKDAARKAWAKALKRAPLDVIAAGTLRMVNDPNLPETRFIPHPATWLNRGGWTDAPYPPRAAAAPSRAAEGLALADQLRERGL